MPAFCCLAGDFANVALLEPGCFTVESDDGRTWLCYELAKMPADPNEASKPFMELMERAARIKARADFAQGKTEGVSESTICMVQCDRLEDLPAFLQPVTVDAEDVPES